MRDKDKSIEELLQEIVDICAALDPKTEIVGRKRSEPTEADRDWLEAIGISW